MKLLMFKICGLSKDINQAPVPLHKQGLKSRNSSLWSSIQRTRFILALRWTTKQHSVVSFWLEPCRILPLENCYICFMWIFLQGAIECFEWQGAETSSRFMWTDHMTVLIPFAVNPDRCSGLGPALPSLVHSTCYWVGSSLQSLSISGHLK